jgi:hypothetical protein
MADSTPERVSSTPPLTQPTAPLRSRTRKPSAKVLEAQRSLRTPLIASRPTQNEPPASATDTCDYEGTSLEEVASLITNLKKTITQQMNVIKAEQQSLKIQNAELQEEIRSLRTQLDTFSVSPPSTQTWASIAVSEHPAGSGAMTLRTMDTGKADYRQLVVDVSRIRETTIERVASTEVAKQAIQQGINGIERLAGAEIKDFRVWRMNNSASVIKFSVERNKEAIFRQTTSEWLEPHIPGARLVGPKWHAVKADWIEVPLAMDIDSGKVSKSAMERFGTENGVEVCTMRWLGQPKPSGQHASVVVKVATKEDAEKLLRSDSVTLGGGGIMVSPFEERRTPVACFRCRRFGHRARDCLRPEACDACGQEGHLQCETTNLCCVNCHGPHRASHRECPEYRKEKTRILTRQHYE